MQMQDLYFTLIFKLQILQNHQLIGLLGPKRLFFISFNETNFCLFPLSASEKEGDVGKFICFAVI